MPRKNAPTPDDFEVNSRYGSGRAEMDDFPAARSEFDAGEVLDSARLVEPEPESPFLRAQKRVPARRGPLPKKAANRLKFVVLAAIAAGALVGSALGLRHYGLKSWRFRIDSSDQIQVSGNQNVTRAQILDLFGGDISRNVFAVPLEERTLQLEQIPWIESATLMRYLPNRLAVVVKERTPVAFVQVGSRIALIDASGVVMDMPDSGTKYSFPVIVGFGETEPLSTRAARMRIYNAIIGDLDSEGAGYSRDLSEVDLSDPDDAKLTLADGNVMVHVGNGKYLDRYKVYVSHVQGWKQQYGALKSVDLRYEGQVIVIPEAELAPVTGQAKAPAATTPASGNAPVAKKPAAAPVASWSAATKPAKAHVTPTKKSRWRKAARMKPSRATTEE